MTTTVPVDYTDPIVVVVAYLVTALAGRFLPKNKFDQYRPLLLVFALAAAVFTRATIDALSGQELGGAVVLRGLAAGFAAVWGDQGLRKLILERLPTTPPEA